MPGASLKPCWILLLLGLSGVHSFLARAPPGPRIGNKQPLGRLCADLRGLEGDVMAQLEAERLMRELEQQSQREEAPAAPGLKYMPTTDASDPIVQALMGVMGASRVEGLDLLDSRWNGNEVLKYNTDVGPFFVKMNRVEDPSVFLTEAVSLSAISKTNTVTCPRPLHLGRLPQVGDTGPGAFMILDYLPLKPFGILRSDMQRQLGRQLAEMHTSRVHDDLHSGRFGFPVSNFLALTPLDNTWDDDWAAFFHRRLTAQLTALYKDKTYGRPALNESDTSMLELGMKVAGAIPSLLGGVRVRPSLIHGDLWVGNAGATAEGPVIFDPAAFFGHSEMELAMMTLFGGFREELWSSYHSVLPREAGFERRQRLYQLYYYLNQLNLFGAPGVRDTCLRLMHELLAEQQPA